MKKFLFVYVFLIFFTATTLEAQWRTWEGRCWRGCRRYRDLTEANYDALPFGYVDNINYPDTYDLPVNRCFNYRPPCVPNLYDSWYLQRCCRYTQEKCY